jgi:sphingomyelin phosphodiesterase acid-like 3
MHHHSIRRLCTLLLTCTLACSALAAPRRHHARRHAAIATTPIPALFLSDIHFDPLRDPIKAPRLDAAPVEEWAAILASPDSPTRDADYAAINARCPIKPLLDPDDRLLHSALDAIQTQARATHARFAVLSGDISGHQYDCRYNLLFPKATHAQFLSFVLKTEQYVLTNLRAALPAIPIYITFGNDDTACHDNSLSPRDDDFLAQAASLAADTLPKLDQAAALRTFPRGYYAASLPIPHTRILVLDDVYQMASYKTCSAQANPSAPQDPAAAKTGQDAQLAWLTTQLKQARRLHQQTWVLAHVPPGVNAWSSYNQNHPNVCAGAPPTTFLADDRLNDLLVSNADVIRLALFGHSHTDEFRLLKSDPDSPAGVPAKILPSISPVFAELPSFTLAKIDPHTATLKDYTVVMASNATGLDATWTPTYTFSDTYHVPDFSPDSLTQLITVFQSDPTAAKPESQTYEREYRHYYADDHSNRIATYWPAAACAIDHISTASFTRCACAAK